VSAAAGQPCGRALLAPRAGSCCPPPSAASSRSASVPFLLPTHRLTSSHHMLPSSLCEAEEFEDPLLGGLMRDPVRLPSGG
jgi:hypothetical protein